METIGVIIGTILTVIVIFFAEGTGSFTLEGSIVTVGTDTYARYEAGECTI